MLAGERQRRARESRGGAALSAEPWLGACGDASHLFHAAHGRRTPENARRVSTDTVAVAGFEPGEFALLEQGEDVDAALTYHDDGRIHEWVVEENIRVEVPATCAAVSYTHLTLPTICSV